MNELNKEPKNGWQWFVKGWNECNDFKGRASRKEFWYFMLFFGVFMVGASLIGYIISTIILYANSDAVLEAVVRDVFTGSSSTDDYILLSLVPMFVLQGLVFLDFIIPMPAIIVRRLRDRAFNMKNNETEKSIIEHI